MRRCSRRRFLLASGTTGSLLLTGTRSTRAIAGAVKDQAVYEDIFWSLLNSTEFLFNH